MFSLLTSQLLNFTCSSSTTRSFSLHTNISAPSSLLTDICTTTFKLSVLPFAKVSTYLPPATIRRSCCCWSEVSLPTCTVPKRQNFSKISICYGTYSPAGMFSYIRISALVKFEVHSHLHNISYLYAFYMHQPMQDPLISFPNYKRILLIFNCMPEHFQLGPNHSLH